MNRWMPLLVSVLLPAVAAAQDEPLEEPPEIRRYTVEIVVFSYNEDISAGTEIFPADTPANPEPQSAIDDEFAVDAQTATDSTITEDAVKPLIRELELVPLESDELTLAGTVRRLELLDAYEPLMHVGWTQPTYPLEETPAIHLRALGAVPPGLDGSFTVYLSRFLHLVVDLALDAPAAAVPDAAADAVLSGTDNEVVFRFGDSRAQNEAEYNPLRGPVRYRIREDRIFRSGELRYFDHPKFGVIAKITRVEDPPAADEFATGESESAGVIGQ